MSSPTVPTGRQSESDVLDVRAAVWRERPLLREIYHRYFAEMCEHLAEGGGTILELGGGSGNFKEYFRSHHANQGTLIASDVVATPHCDLVADAMALPFGDGSLDNIVMMDVLHHVPFPLRFFAEAQRVLRPGGRIVMMEPYVSPASRLVFKLAHPEPAVTSAVVFGDPDPSPVCGEGRGGAFASNQATPTLIFYRDLVKFRRRFDQLKLIVRKRRSLLLYPLSGGFSGPKLMPYGVGRFLWPLERILSPLAGLMAFRLLVVLERTACKHAG